MELRTLEQHIARLATMPETRAPVNQLLSQPAEAGHPAIRMPGTNK